MRCSIIILVLVLFLGCSQKTEQEEAAIGETSGNDSAKTVTKPKRVTGIGGIFFKSKDPEKLRQWYGKHLGLEITEYGSLFEFRSTDEPEKKGYLQWSPFSEKTKYFEPSHKEFMINYRVADLERLLEELEMEGVQIVGELESYEYGKFAHVMDPEGNKIELWEPVDSIFTELYEGKSTH